MTADLLPSGTPPFSAPDRSSLRRYLPFPGFGETHSVRHLAEQENHLFVPACRAGRAGVIPQVAVAHRSRPVAEVTASRPGPASGGAHRVRERGRADRARPRNAAARSSDEAALLLHRREPAGG